MGFEPSASPPVAYHSHEPPLKPARRADEWTKWTPVVFVSLNIGFLYFVYVFHHILPTLQFHLPAEHVDAATRQRAIVEVSFFHMFFALLLYCYVCSIVTHPGAIPDDPEWERTAEDPSLTNKEDAAKDNMQERKRSGDRRYCKWCGKYKPDRCHHCRVCKSCILKMDHHCPWIYNCVGFRNHKYFFLLLFYCVCTCQLIMWSMLGSVKRSMMVDTPFVMMFFLLFGETLAFFFGVLVTGFFCFHIWLMFNALTTIEFCEKALKKSGSFAFSYSSVYNSGPYSCITSILGDQPFLWLLPVSPAAGDGLHFLTDTTPLTKSMQESRVIRKRTHQRVPRNVPRAPVPAAGGSGAAGVGGGAAGGGYGAVDNYMVRA